MTHPWRTRLAVWLYDLLWEWICEHASVAWDAEADAEMQEYEASMAGLERALGIVKHEGIRNELRESTQSHTEG